MSFSTSANSITRLSSALRFSGPRPTLPSRNKPACRRVHLSLAAHHRIASMVPIHRVGITFARRTNELVCSLCQKRRSAKPARLFSKRSAVASFHRVALHFFLTTCTIHCHSARNRVAAYYAFARRIVSRAPTLHAFSRGVSRSRLRMLHSALLAKLFSPSRL